MVMTENDKVIECGGDVEDIGNDVEFYLDLEDGVRMGENKGVFSRFFAVPNIPSPEIVKYRKFKFELNPPMVHYWPGVNRGKDVLGRLTQDRGRVLLSDEEQDDDFGENLKD